jgi:hypothetical protein
MVIIILLKNIFIFLASFRVIGSILECKKSKILMILIVYTIENIVQKTVKGGVLGCVLGWYGRGAINTPPLTIYQAMENIKQKTA